MKNNIKHFIMILCASLLCTGLFFTSCEVPDPLGGGNTQQNGNNGDNGSNGNNGNEGSNENGDGEEAAKDPLTVSLSKVTATTATFTGQLNVPEEDLSSCKVIVYYHTSRYSFNMKQADSVSINTFDKEQNFTTIIKSLPFATAYDYVIVAELKEEKISGEVMHFSTNDVAITLAAKENPIITEKPVVAEFEGSISGLSEEDKEGMEIGLVYSSVLDEVSRNKGKKIRATEISDNGHFNVVSDSLAVGVRYYYSYYTNLSRRMEIRELDVMHPSSMEFDFDMSSATDLSESASANCYIVSNEGNYKFKAVQGNSKSSVGDVASVALIWESFGTDVAPERKDLIEGVCYFNGYIGFRTTGFKEGNALIAAKDAQGNIIWSWHIWLTDEPQAQTYDKGAGVMMDRNLGATSTASGEVTALGLLYQWGRKDPFMGSDAIKGSSSAANIARSTHAWPTPVDSDASTGTIEFATAHPTTFIQYAEDENAHSDWFYTGCSVTDNTRWATSAKGKTIYDPCPAGWRVPNGGESGIWAKALGSSSEHEVKFYSNGIYFADEYGVDNGIWYPAAGYNFEGHSVGQAGNAGYYWSASQTSRGSGYAMVFSSYGIQPARSFDLCAALSVRCSKE